MWSTNKTFFCEEIPTVCLFFMIYMTNAEYWRGNSSGSHRIYLYYSVRRPDPLIIKILYFKIESICTLNIKTIEFNSILENYFNIVRCISLLRKESIIQFWRKKCCLQLCFVLWWLDLTQYKHYLILQTSTCNSYAPSITF